MLPVQFRCSCSGCSALPLRSGSADCQFCHRQRWHRAICLGDGAGPAFGGIGVFHGVAQSVSFAEQVAILVVGVAGDLLESVRYLGDVVQGTIYNKLIVRKL